MKIRIECDGVHTKVTNAETGESLRATKVMFTAAVGEAPKIVVECFCPEVDACIKGEIADCTQLDSHHRQFAIVQKDA